jgi:hypothetical protein
VRRSFLLWAALPAIHCGGADGDVSLTFPDELTRATTTNLALTVIEPIYTHQNGDLELLTCSRVGVFPPPRLLDIDKLTSVTSGRLLSGLREAYEYPFEDLELSFPNVPESDQTNPWGVVMMIVEARAAVRSANPSFGNPIGTIASGCTCFRTREGRGGDPVLDNQIRQRCPLLEDSSEREIVLAPILPEGFVIEPCAEVCATASPGGALGTSDACIREVFCGAGAPSSCFKCPDNDCPERDDLSNVPVVFQTGDRTQVLMSESTGVLTASIELEACAEGQTLSVRPLGAASPSYELPLSCVPAISSFTCTDTLLPNEGEIIDFDALAGTGVAILYRSTAAVLHTFNPASNGVPVNVRLSQRNAVGSHLFHYQLAPKSRPIWAVSTTAEPNLGQAPRVDLFELNNGVLEPRGTFSSTCGGVACADGRCDTGPVATSLGPLASGDVDGDNFADLAVTGDTDNAVVVGWLSGRTSGGDLYQGTGCTCGRYSQSTTQLLLEDFGGEPAGLADLVFGNTFGGYVQYGTRDGVFPDCGTVTAVQRAAGIRDVAAGSFGCAVNAPLEKRCAPSCSQGRDLVYVGRAVGQIPGDAFVLLAREGNVDLEERDRANYRVRATDVDEKIEPLGAETGDFNGDGFDDLAILYGGPGELRVWLGARNGALSLSPVRVETCPEGRIAAADFDTDGRTELAMICRTGDSFRFRSCVAELTQPR